MKGQHSSTMKDKQKGNFASTPRRMVSVDTQVNDGQVNQRQDEEEATGEARPTLICPGSADIIGPNSEVSTGGRTSVSSLSTAATSSPSSDYWSKRHLKDRKSRRSQMSSTTRGSRSAAAKEGATATTTRAPAGPSSSSLDVMTTTPGAFHVTPSRIDAIGNTQEEQSALPSAPKDDEAEEEEPVIDDKILDETPILESTAQIVQAELAPDTSAIVAQEVRRQVQKELQRHYNTAAITNSDEILVVAATTKVIQSNDEETNKATTAQSRTTCCHLNKCWICFTSLLFILVLILGLTVTMMLRNGSVDTGTNESNSDLSTPPPEDLDVLLPTMSPTSSLRGSFPANSSSASP